MTTIIGIKIDQRKEISQQLQNILTEYGCIIKTRIGIHDVRDNYCSPDGIVILEVINQAKGKYLQEKLCDLDGIEIQTIEFN